MSRGKMGIEIPRKKGESGNEWWRSIGEAREGSGYL